MSSWERTTYTDKPVGETGVFGRIGNRDVYHPERFALTYQWPDRPNTTTDLPDLGCWTDDAVVAIEGKFHWAVIEPGGDIRIVRKADHSLVLFIDEISGQRDMSHRGHVYECSEQGNYADHAMVSLDTVDRQAQFFFTLAATEDRA